MLRLCYRNKALVGCTMLKFIQLVRRVGPRSLVGKTAMKLCYCWPTNRRPFPVAEQSIAWVYGRPPALLGMQFQIPPRSCMSVWFDCFVLSGRGLFFGLITRPEDSYRLLCVWVWSWSFDNKEALAHKGQGEKKRKLIACRPEQRRSLYALRQVCAVFCVVGVTSEGFVCVPGTWNWTVRMNN